MKRIFAMILAAALLLVLAGCDSIIGTKKEIAVTTLEEFLEAIGSGRTIRLDAEILLSEAEEGFDKDPPWPGSEIVHFEEVSDGWELVIKGVKDLTIRCGPKGSLVTAPRYSFVLIFDNCEGITLEGLTAGHTRGSDCAGGVFRFTECKDVKLIDCDLYGCGTEGLVLENVDGFAMEGGSIYECTDNIMTVMGGGNISFKGCTFRDNGAFTLVGFGNVKGLLFEDCLFEGNHAEGYAMFNEAWDSGGCENILAKKCTFRNNRAKALTYTDAIIFEDCIFEGNSFDGENGNDYKEGGALLPAALLQWGVGISNAEMYSAPTRIVAFGGMDENRSYTRAVWGGQNLNIKYIGDKESDANEFLYFADYPNLAGPDYEILSPRPEGRSFFLYHPDNWGGAAGKIIFPTNPDASREYDGPEIATMEQAQGGRKIIRTDLLGEFTLEGANGRLLMVRYENQEDGLFEIVLFHGDDTFTAEFRCKLSEYGGEANWRADLPDEPGWWELLFVGMAADGPLLVTTWAASEGEYLMPYLARHGKLEEIELPDAFFER